MNEILDMLNLSNFEADDTLTYEELIKVVDDYKEEFECHDQ